MINQDYPKSNLEILVVDGDSQDGTREILAECASKNELIRIIGNPKKITPVGLNIGIREAKGSIVIRTDAHAYYGKDYVSQCLKYLNKCNADNVGGAIRTLPSKKGIWAKAISIVLSHPFGAGNSFFRIGTAKPRWVDTVFGGCYRKEIFQKIGLFNEKMIRSQDIELNKRLRKSGGKILLVPDIKVCYYPQSSFADFFKHNFSDGLWTIYPLKFGIRIFSWRHLVPLFFIMAQIALAELSFFSSTYQMVFLSLNAAYFFLAIAFSFFISLKEKDLMLIFVLPVVFANRHFGYGLGSFWGIIKNMLG